LTGGAIGDDGGRVGQPRALLVATQLWLSHAVLGRSLRQAGFHVEAVCRATHPICALAETVPRHRLGIVDESRSIGRAMRSARPDVVIPCDDPAVAILHDLHAQDRGGELARAIERSLGDPGGYAIVRNKSALLELARSEGLNAPASSTVASLADVEAQIEARSLPLVLKRDCTWAGAGVRVLRRADDARTAWRHVAGWISVLRDVRSAQRNLRPNAVIHRLLSPPACVQLQEFVAGRPANRAVVCKNGEVLAGATVLVLETLDPTGLSSVVDLIEHPEMENTVAVLARRLRLTGFFGFDFVVTPSNTAYLLEANPRATPIAPLRFKNGTWLPGVLFAAVTGRSATATEPAITSNRIAFFPNEWKRDPESAYLRSAHHAVPWDEPALLRHCIRVGAGATRWFKAPRAIERELAELKALRR
jgi:carbamoylphosphate synthase large subunit